MLETILTHHNWFNYHKHLKYLQSIFSQVVYYMTK